MNAARGLLPQFEVIHAIILRETRTRFGTHQLGYLWAFIEPILWILTFYLMFDAMGRQPPPGMTMVGFVATGLIPFQIFRETVGRASNAVDANKSLLFYPQVRPLDLIIARCSLEGLTSTAVLAVILGFEGLVLGKLRVDDPLMVLLSLFMAVLLGGALGVVVGSLSVFSNTVSRIVPVLLRPLFWVSGIFFTANTLPSHVRNFMLYNPVLHLVELTRGGYFADYDATYASPMYVCAWAITLLALGLMLERVARRRLELT